MKHAILSSKAPKSCIETLRSLGYRTLTLPPFKKLSEPVNTHADMLFFSYNSIIVTHRDYYETARCVFDALCSEHGIRLVLADDDIQEEYPHDIAYNAIMLDGTVFSNTPYTSKEILHLSSRSVKVKQGYTACSTLALNDNRVITADSSLAREYERDGIRVVLISNGSISLPPYDCGFIGGASGVDGDTVYFTGSIDSHKNADIIKSAITSVGMKYISLSNDPLYDIGGIRFF